MTNVAPWVRSQRLGETPVTVDARASPELRQNECPEHFRVSEKTGLARAVEIGRTVPCEAAPSLLPPPLTISRPETPSLQVRRQLGRSSFVFAKARAVAVFPAGNTVRGGKPGRSRASREAEIRLQRVHSLRIPGASERHSCPVPRGEHARAISTTQREREPPGLLLYGDLPWAPSNRPLESSWLRTAASRPVRPAGEGRGSGVMRYAAGRRPAVAAVRGCNLSRTRTTRSKRISERDQRQNLRAARRI